MKISKKILVVDDEPAIRELLSSFLEIMDYEVESALNGKDAIEIIEKNNFSIIISDVKMPDINGIDLLKKVKEFNKKIEVILITGFPNNEDREQALKLGAYAYIPKPFKLQIIANILEEIFKKGN